MRTTTSSRTSRRALLTLLALFPAIGASGGTAAAECHRPPDCPPETPECIVCEDPVGDFQGDSGSQSIIPQTTRSVASDLGRIWLDAKYPNMSHAPLPPPPPRTADATPEGYQQVRDFISGLGFVEHARSGRANLEDALHWTVSGSGADGVPVPRAQGVDRDIDASGIPSLVPDADFRADPIDPITGELVVEHTDLSFPGFGVPFVHTRVYRSRTDYDGPLGPGWDFSFNQRFVVAPVVDAPSTGNGLDPDTGLPIVDGTDTDPETDHNDETDTVTQHGRYCGPVLLLTTGNASTLRFRERSRVDNKTTYESGATDLTLTGAIDTDGSQWDLRSKAGDVRHFDSRGLLTSWVDANGVGLRLEWEGASQHDWRLARYPFTGWSPDLPAARGGSTWGSRRDLTYG